jgi:hypothetical protein
MMTVEQMRTLAGELRGSGPRYDGDLNKVVTAIEADVAEYRRIPVAQNPDGETADALRLMGWLMYEVTWTAVQQIPHRFRQEGGAVAEKANQKYEVILRVSNAARELPWPEYAVRALGAFRALALAESKHDNEAAYVRAQTLHLEARTRHGNFLTYHANRRLEEKAPELRSLDEIFLQLALAETGTACRTAEMVLDRWLEDFAPKGEDEDVRLRRLFEQMSSGADIGEQALEAADRVWRLHGFVDEVGEDGLALPTSFINPGVMTARTILLMLALFPEMERLGFYPLGEDNSWNDTRKRLRDRFNRAYQYIERPIKKSSGEQIEPRSDLQIAIVQIRTAAGLLMPGHDLPTSLSFAPCLSHRVLDDDAVEDMSAWLTETIVDNHGRSTQRSTYRGFGGAILPNFFTSVEACRAAFGGTPGYRAWRARWFVLDKLANEEGRAERVSEVLGIPVQRTRPI